jgi:hypothetical protein
MSESFLHAATMREIDAGADAGRPLPIDDALAALELHGPICELGAGAGVWSALLRARGLVSCICYDPLPPKKTHTEVLRGDHAVASEHPDHTLLLVRGARHLDRLLALEAYHQAGGRVVALVADEEFVVGDLEFSAALLCDFERQITVVLPGSDRLYFWVKRPPPPAAGSSAPAKTYGVLDVKLELVDLEAPDWAAATANGPDAPQTGGPFVPQVGGRTISVMGGTESAGSAAMAEDES